MWQEVFRASITKIESCQFAELIFDSSLSPDIRSGTWKRLPLVKAVYYDWAATSCYAFPGSLAESQATQDVETVAPGDNCLLQSGCNEHRRCIGPGQSPRLR